MEGSGDGDHWGWGRGKSLVFGESAVDQLSEITLGELALCLFFEERRFHE